MSVGIQSGGKEDDKRRRKKVPREGVREMTTTIKERRKELGAEGMMRGEDCNRNGKLDVSKKEGGEEDANNTGT